MTIEICGMDQYSQGVCDGSLAGSRRRTARSHFALATFAIDIFHTTFGNVASTAVLAHHTQTSYKVPVDGAISSSGNKTHTFDSRIATIAQSFELFVEFLHHEAILILRLLSNWIGCRCSIPTTSSLIHIVHLFVVKIAHLTFFVGDIFCNHIVAFCILLVACTSARWSEHKLLSSWMPFGTNFGKHSSL